MSPSVTRTIKRRHLDAQHLEENEAEATDADYADATTITDQSQQERQKQEEEGEGQKHQQEKEGKNQQEEQDADEQVHYTEEERKEDLETNLYFDIIADEFAVSDPVFFNERYYERTSVDFFLSSIPPLSHNKSRGTAVFKDPKNNTPFTVNLERPYEEVSARMRREIRAAVDDYEARTPRCQIADAEASRRAAERASNTRNVTTIDGVPVQTSTERVCELPDSYWQRQDEVAQYIASHEGMYPETSLRREFPRGLVNPTYSEMAQSSLEQDAKASEAARVNSSSESSDSDSVFHFPHVPFGSSPVQRCRPVVIDLETGETEEPESIRMTAEDDTNTSETVSVVTPGDGTRTRQRRPQDSRRTRHLGSLIGSSQGEAALVFILKAAK